MLTAALHCPHPGGGNGVGLLGKRWNFSSSATTTIRHRDGWKLEETRAFVALLPVGTGDTPSIDICIGKVSKLNITSEVDF